MNTLRVAQGTASTFTITLDPSQAPYSYTGSETLVATVWSGNDLAALWTATPTWTSTSSGTLSLTIPSSRTSGMLPGFYRLLITSTYSGVTNDIAECLLEVSEAAGSAAVRPTYITARDLRNIAPWIDDLQDPEKGEAGFLDACADARDWVDEAMIRQYRGGDVSLLGWHGTALNSWFDGGPRRTSLTNLWLKQQLAANTLIVTPKVKKVCAHKALAIICGQSTTAKYQALEAKYQRAAHALLASSVFEICLSGDGVTPSIAISFTTTNTLFA